MNEKANSRPLPKQVRVGPAVYHLQPDREGGSGPVYAQAGGVPAVPTGRIFVRFRDGVDAAGRREALAGAGYDLDEVPAYAPQAAWVRARSGDLGESLAGVAGLEKLPDVESVEPQMIREAVSK